VDGELAGVRGVLGGPAVCAGKGREEEKGIVGVGGELAAAAGGVLRVEILPRHSSVALGRSEGALTDLIGGAGDVLGAVAVVHAHGAVGEDSVCGRGGKRGGEEGSREGARGREHRGMGVVWGICCESSSGEPGEKACLSVYSRARVAVQLRSCSGCILAPPIPEERNSAATW
jgi:hypothetical protein